MFIQIRKLVVVLVVGWLAVAYAVDRPDYYTSGFYTRGSDEADYVGQGGVLDPFHVPVQSWELIPRATLEMKWDDNYNLSPDDPEAEHEISLIPGILFMYGKQEHNHLYTDLSGRFPLSQSAESASDKPSYAVVVGGAFKTGKSQIYGRVGHRRLEEANVQVGSRVVNIDYTGDVGVEHRISTKTSLGALGSIEYHDFDDDQYSNYRRTYGAGRVYRRLTPKSELYLQAGVGADAVDNKDSAVSSDASFYDLSIGMRGKPSPKTGVSGRVGYQWRQSDNASRENADSWIASLGADATPFGLSRFSVELLSDIRPDIESAGSSVIDQRIVLGVDRRLFTERLRGRASVKYGEIDYRSTPYAAGADDYWGVDLGLDWWTRRNLSLGIAYSHLTRNGEERNSYESNQLILRMSWNY